MGSSVKKPTRVHQKASKPAVVKPQLQGQTHEIHPLLELQQTIGNRAVIQLLGEGLSPSQMTAGPTIIQRIERVHRQRTTKRSKPKRIPKTPSRYFNISLTPKNTIRFSTTPVQLGKVRVFITGRMSISGRASLVGQKLPRRRQAQFVRNQVRLLVQTALFTTVPTGNAAKILANLAGSNLILELVPGAGNSPAFQVTGRFRARNKTITVPGCEIKRARITTDATVWIAPAKPAGAKTPRAKGPTPSDAIVKSYSYMGKKAKLKGRKQRSGSVALESAMDAFEKKVPAFVKNHRFLQLPEQRMAFFQHMRSYFGTDDKTIEHFAKMRVAKIKGRGKTYLHDEAATRLEAVQAEIGIANMPTSYGVGWPRAECNLKGRQTKGNLHQIGFAIDYNAVQMPMLKDRRILDLLQIVTGRSPSATYGSPGSLNKRKVGETFTKGTKQQKQKMAADPRVKKWLNTVEKEAKELSKASETFRGSLKTTVAGKQIDLAPKLQKLRSQWFAAKTDSERQRILKQLPTVLKPWIDKVDAQRKAAKSNVELTGLKPTNLPSGKQLRKSIKATARLQRQVNSYLRRWGKRTKLSRWLRKRARRLIAQGRKITGMKGAKATNDTDLISYLNNLAVLLAVQKTALGHKKWLDRVTKLQKALTSDAKFVFGKRKRSDVIDPGLAQLVDKGFFTIKGKPKAGPGAFGVDFIKSMVKHGFNHGAKWTTPDYMHFELRWKGPGM